MKNKNQNNAKAKKHYPKRSAVFFAFAVLCLVYYLVVLLYGGSHTSVIWVWLVGASFFSVVGAVFFFLGRLPTENALCLIAVVLVVGLFSSFAVFEICMIRAALSDAPDDLECIVILGAAVKGEEPSKALRYRLDAALKYLERNPDTVAVPSGGMGYGENITEAECMRRYLTNAGIDGSRLIIEDESRDTSENIKNTLALIGDRYDSIGITTNNFHVYRAMRLMRAETDAELYGISAPFPSPLIVHFAVREYIGMCHDTLRGNIG